MVSQTLPNPILQSYLVTSCNDFADFLAKQLCSTTTPNNKKIMLNNNSPVKLNQKEMVPRSNFQKARNHPKTLKWC